MVTEEILNDLIDPEDDAKWKRAAGMMLLAVDAKVQRTNGRVTKLERFMWAAGGGLAVVTAVVVPLFIKTVLEG